jgi:hypothetical protein
MGVEVAGGHKPTAHEAFELNINDAQMLVSLARLLENQRRRRMRRELRERVGAALRIPRRHWEKLECLENDEVFVAFKPGHEEWRASLSSDRLAPLLRQAVVAATAAVETFVADRVMELYAEALKLDPPPPRLQALPLTVGDWMRIEDSYQRRGWGLRHAVELKVRQLASPNPRVINELFAMVGHKDVMRRVDGRRRVPEGTSIQELDAIRQRRNKIAHEGDRRGRGRAPIDVVTVEKQLEQVTSIVQALDAMTSAAANAGGSLSRAGPRPRTARASASG